MTGLNNQNLRKCKTNLIKMEEVIKEALTKEEFFAKIDEETKKMPDNWREGQKIFNAIDIIFGIAREVQFRHGVDCFHDNSKIDSFKDKAYEVYKEYFKNIEK